MFLLHDFSLSRSVFVLLSHFEQTNSTHTHTVSGIGSTRGLYRRRRHNIWMTDRIFQMYWTGHHPSYNFTSLTFPTRVSTSLFLLKTWWRVYLVFKLWQPWFWWISNRLHNWFMSTLRAPLPCRVEVGAQLRKKGSSQDLNTRFTLDVYCRMGCTRSIRIWSDGKRRLKWWYTKDDGK